MSTTDDSLPRLVSSTENHSNGTWTFLNESGKPTDLITGFGPSVWGRISEASLKEQDTTGTIWGLGVRRRLTKGITHTVFDRWDQVTVRTPGGKQTAWALVLYHKEIAPVSEQEENKLNGAIGREVTCTEDQPFMRDNQGGWKGPLTLDTELAERCDDGAWKWMLCEEGDVPPNPATIQYQGATVRCSVVHELELVMGGDPDVLQKRHGQLSKPGIIFFDSDESDDEAQG